jgi:radical SAM superfamily enzyme YgiQ (UPF0313 family)
MRQVLLIDIPVVPVELPPQAQHHIRRKLLLESMLRQSKLPGVICPAIPYTRGLLIVAAALKKAGIVVNYVVWSDPKDRCRIKDFARSASVVGISCMTSGHDVAASIATQVRALNPQTCIVLGGPHATALGSQLFETMPALDAVVKGDGHFAMVDIAQSAPMLDGIAGVATRAWPDPAIRHEQYSDSPIPAYELLYRSLDEYAHSLRTFHGCPYSCSFCVEGLTWREGSVRNIETVYDELTHLFCSIPKGTLIHFSDPVFNIDSRRTAVLCDWLSNNAPYFYFSMDTRIDLLSTERVDVLRRAGFRYFRVGVESLLPDLLDKAHKGWDPMQVYDSLGAIRESAPDSIIHAYWITGLPGSTHDTTEQSIEDAKNLLQSNLIDILSNKVLVPYPGTNYYAAPNKFGMQLLEKSWSAYDRLSVPVFNLDTISAEEIYRCFCRTEIIAAEALEQRFEVISEPINSTRYVETYKSIAYLNAENKL